VILDVSVGASLALVAWLVRGRRPIAVALAAASLTWFAGSMWPAAAAAHRGPFVAALLLAGARRLRWLEPVVIGVVALDGVVGWFTRSGPVTLTLALLIGLAAVARPARGRVASITRAAAVADALVLAAIGGLLIARRTVAHQGDLYAAAVLVITWSLAAAIRRTRIEQLVIDLSAAPASGRLVGVLRDVVGDPTVELVVGVSPPPTRPGRTSAPLRRSGAVVGFLVHDAAVLADDVALAGATAVATIVAEAQHARVRAAASLAEIERSSRMLAEARAQEGAALARRLSVGPVARLDAAVARLGEGLLASQLLEARRELLDVASDLAPLPLVERGLAGAIGDRAAVAPVPVRCRIDAPGLSAATERALFLICSEALANAGKHAAASEISVEIAVAGDQLQAAIRDDGRGGADPDGSGLRGMAERVHSFGGTMAIDSPRGRGTSICITAPWELVCA
jgi:hypothetical protein